VTALAGAAVDEVRRREAASSPELRASLKHTLYAWRKNPENLTEKEQGRLDDLDLRHLATGQAYLVRLELRDIYQRTVRPAKARHRLTSWLGWVRGKCGRFGDALAPLAKAANTIERHREGIPGPLDPRRAQHRLPGGPQQRLQRREAQGPRLSQPRIYDRHALLRRRHAQPPLPLQPLKVARNQPNVSLCHTAV
jgi:hypothetical protein